MKESVRDRNVRKLKTLSALIEYLGNKPNTLEEENERLKLENENLQNTIEKMLHHNQHLGGDDVE